ncbi:winged helix-turn-helix domain-containing protein [Burkholderia oklahomensis]|uniref:OmpR/PhoB-type domain-containing protein n=1 Tax=Burkholderia oklahomensis TaxID=342113 RepID=A0AAI8FRL4_9BURK|nr:helix-turn-helix domain-containing protein [Burkholderia oklahomensis]AIO70130.1 hypothetical protein DM82_5865 [Burkholderia oklahomensis]
MSIYRKDNITRLTPNETELLSILMKGTVRKQAVIEQVWGSKGLVVADGSYHQLIRTLRVKLAEQDLASNTIKTLPRLGLKFVGTIEFLADFPAVDAVQYPTAQTDLPPNRNITDSSVTNVPPHEKYGYQSTNFKFIKKNVHRHHIFYLLVMLLSFSFIIFTYLISSTHLN